MIRTGTVRELLEGSTSQINFDDGSSMVTPDLAERGVGLAARLSSHLEPGDRLAIWLDPGLDYLELLAAAAAGGFVAVNVNTRYSNSEAIDLIERSGAKLLVSDFDVKPKGGCLRLNPSDLGDLPESLRSFAASPDTPFVVFTTSGTTSKPKMVLHNQGAFVRHSREIVRRFGLSPSTPALVALPLCGVFGLNSFLAAVAADSQVWVTGRFDADMAGAEIAEQQIKVMNGSDDMFNRLLETTHDLSSLQIAGYGSFNTSLEDIPTTAEARGAKLSGLYGMSEVQALYAFADQDLVLPERGIAGGQLTSPDAALRIADADTNAELQLGSVGEIQLKGPSLFVGYLEEGGEEIDTELTDSSHSDGWFKTGDLGSVNPDGSLRFISRMGDVLRLGGFLVAPLEIEEVILESPEISEAQVVSISSSGGTRPVAFVIEHADQPKGNPARLEAKIIERCQARLAKFKCPVRVISLASFPVTDGPNGVKIQRTILRELAAELVTL